MERKMFGHRLKKSNTSNVRDPGLPVSDMDMPEGRAKDNPPNYEGKEHVRYKNPGFSKHHIRYPEDEPHMKSRVSKEESHEAEDDYHMGVPDQTDRTLPRKIPRARMLMDAPNQQDPKPLLGNLVDKVSDRGMQDETGEEEMGPNYMQEEPSKEDRKKMIVAVTKRKMRKQGYNDRMDESLGERRGRKPESYEDRRDESEGEEESRGKRKFKGLRSSY